MPSGHSHSSHSSHSHSSHSHSSHSHSSHSYSSHSSSYRSSSSHSPSYSSQARSAITRPRVSDNGYESRDTKYVKLITGYNHKYRHFNTPWYDNNGTSHTAGYYDENNKRYDGVFVERDKTVVCYCEYCGNTSSFDARTTQEFQCSSCGAPMNVIKVEQDEALRDCIADNEYDYKYKVKKNFPLILRLVVMLTALMSMFIFLSSMISSNNNTTRYNSSSNKYSSGTIYLTKTTLNNCYKISTEPSENYSIAMRWDGENYYDDKLDYYAYYNTEVSPAMWQYWYEPISGNYGDYGWIEYDETSKDWWVEDTAGHWICASDMYDTSMLYYIVE